MATTKEYTIKISLKYVYNPPEMILKINATSEKAALQFARDYVAEHSLKFEIVKDN
jgi:hypothetical protein